MSAFDIVGVIMWGLLAFMFTAATVSFHLDGDRAGVRGAFYIAFPCLAAFIFCVARLFGAHL